MLWLLGILYSEHFSTCSAKSVWFFQNIPTLGTVAITMALHNCDEVAVAGFGYDMNALHAPLHYYEKLKMSAIKEVTAPHTPDLKNFSLKARTHRDEFHARYSPTFNASWLNKGRQCECAHRREKASFFSKRLGFVFLVWRAASKTIRPMRLALLLTCLEQLKLQ